MLSVALNRDLCCPDLWDIFISSANWCPEQFRKGGLFSAGSGGGALPPPHPTFARCRGLGELRHGLNMVTFPIVSLLLLQNIAVCLFAHVKNKQNQPTTEKGVQKK